MEPQVVLHDLVLVALLTAGGARVSSVTSRGQGRPCDLAVDVSRLDREALSAKIGELADGVRQLPPSPSARDFVELFDGTVLSQVDDNLKAAKARIARARRNP